MEKKYNIGIIVVSYHNPTMTARYVRVELPKLTTPYKLIIVNNDSTPEECDKLAELCGVNRDDVVCSRENLGYAKGNNLGVISLKERGIKCSHYLFSNDDVEIMDRNILDVLASHLDDNSEIGAIGPRIKGLDGKDQSPHDTYISPYRLIGWKLLYFLRKAKTSCTTSETKLNPSRYTYWVQGSFMMLKADVFENVGMFDERTFLYFEEVILAERLSKIGKKMYFCSDVTILHYEGGSSKDSKIKNIFEMESRSLYFREYKKVPQIFIYLCNKIYG